MSLAFSEILNFLKFEQQVHLQILSKKFYELVIPRYLQHRSMTVRPTFVYFNFQNVKWQKWQIQRNANSSESKSSGDEMGTFLFGDIWYYYHDAKPIPWKCHKIKISPALVTKGFKTVITNTRFRAFLIGGTNSAQNYEYILSRNVLKERKFMHTCRAYFADCQKDDRYIYAIGGRGDQSLIEFEQFKLSQRTMERYDIEKDRWLALSTELN
mmetsp:Transcript_39537/g.60378  ORF Transcript_39537/g.60378 Transcript_39537/m.60378 type:complete len:212 (+) Transcript_39537:202-837(+)|eukprot:CAMPEP_0170494722 /NCGR_PEP_ID=MMETSP0208-20121228/14800_1 /TAXON_ID=197538 /ORGANISM="Strombidium inclinatum, Strain S3" /LENGTH=211 /DNA_ID=CAMNT_0010770811 /DNA_START=201 /DNA_END=836 /DNA_ORIENTATION=-